MYIIDNKGPNVDPCGQGCRSPRGIGAVVQIFVEHWGDNSQFFPNFALFPTLGEMNLDQDFFQVSKLSKDQKKRSSPEMENFFSPNSSTDLPSDAHQSQIIGG